MSRRRARPAAWRADRDQGPVRLQARLAVHLRRRSRDEGLRRAMALPRSPSGSRRPAPSSWARPTARRWACAAPATTTCSARRAILSTCARTPAAPRAAAPQRSPTGSCRSPKAPTPAARSASRPPGATWSASRPSFGRVPVVMRPNAFGGDMPFVFEGPISRTVEDAALALSVLAGYDPRDPFSIETNEDFLAATRRSIKGWKIAYSPDLDVFPVDAGGSRRRRRRPSRCLPMRARRSRSQARPQAQTSAN